MKFVINGKDLKEFKIVRPHYNSSYLTQIEMENLCKLAKNAANISLSIVEDAYTPEGENEIVVGNANRAGVEKITDYNEYRITVAGDKVYLNGGSPYATAMAVSEFAKLLKSKDVTDADSVVGSYKGTARTYDGKKCYKPVWIDDFDGENVDESKWYIIDEEYTNKGADGLSGKNGKRAWRKPSNVNVEDGCFHALYTQDEGNYYGGTIRTLDKFSYKYGYVETSAKLPQGNGFWSTLWMHSAEKTEFIGPEIDVNESFGSSLGAKANAHVWPNEKGKGERSWNHRSFDSLRRDTSTYRLPEDDEQTLKDAFHTYGFLWTEDYIAFTADGKIYVEMDLNEPGLEDFKEAFTCTRVKMILSGTPGFANCPLPQNATDEEWEKYSIYSVDYVHVYQLDDGGKSELVADSVFEW